MATKKKTNASATTTTTTKARTTKSDEIAAVKPTPVSGGVDFEPHAHPDAKLSKKQAKQLLDVLLVERERLLKGLGEHLGDAISNIDPLSDEMDIAQRHTEQAYLMRFADKERKLLGEIANAIEKLETGDYGLCEGTGEPIAFKRLELRPWTRYSVEYKEQMEREKKQHQR